jgi:hypothetical protein
VTIPEKSLERKSALPQRSASNNSQAAANVARENGERARLSGGYTYHQPRFLKPPPPSAEGQKVLSRKGQKKAAITPYLLVCLQQLLRDATVRQGIYEIPELGVRFMVSEWRPRFGMAYDPPLHQAWVILCGAPLQMWTRLDITRMLQSFGYCTLTTYSYSCQLITNKYS